MFRLTFFNMKSFCFNSVDWSKSLYDKGSNGRVGYIPEECGLMPDKRGYIPDKRGYMQEEVGYMRRSVVV